MLSLIKSKGKLHCLYFPTKNIIIFLTQLQILIQHTFRRYWGGGGVREVLEVVVDFRYGELFFCFLDKGVATLSLSLIFQHSQVGNGGVW